MNQNVIKNKVDVAIVECSLTQIKSNNQEKYTNNNDNNEYNEQIIKNIDSIKSSNNNELIESYQNKQKLSKQNILEFAKFLRGKIFKSGMIKSEKKDDPFQEKYINSNHDFVLIMKSEIIFENQNNYKIEEKALSKKSVENQLKSKDFDISYNDKIQEIYLMNNKIKNNLGKTFYYEDESVHENFMNADFTNFKKINRLENYFFHVKNNLNLNILSGAYLKGFVLEDFSALEYDLNKSFNFKNNFKSFNFVNEYSKVVNHQNDSTSSLVSDNQNKLFNNIKTSHIEAVKKTKMILLFNEFDLKIKENFNNFLQSFPSINKENSFDKNKKNFVNFILNQQKSSDNTLKDIVNKSLVLTHISKNFCQTNSNNADEKRENIFASSKLEENIKTNSNFYNLNVVINDNVQEEYDDNTKAVLILFIEFFKRVLEICEIFNNNSENLTVLLLIDEFHKNYKKSQNNNIYEPENVINYFFSGLKEHFISIDNKYEKCFNHIKFLSISPEENIFGIPEENKTLNKKIKNKSKSCMKRNEPTESVKITGRILFVDKYDIMLFNSIFKIKAQKNYFLCQSNSHKNIFSTRFTNPGTKDNFSLKSLNKDINNLFTYDHNLNFLHENIISILSKIINEKKQVNIIPFYFTCNELLGRFQIENPRCKLEDFLLNNAADNNFIIGMLQILNKLKENIEGSSLQNFIFKIKFNHVIKYNKSLSNYENSGLFNFKIKYFYTYTKESEITKIFRTEFENFTKNLNFLSLINKYVYIFNKENVPKCDKKKELFSPYYANTRLCEINLIRVFATNRKNSTKINDETKNEISKKLGNKLKYKHFHIEDNITPNCCMGFKCSIF